MDFYKAVKTIIDMANPPFWLSCSHVLTGIEAKASRYVPFMSPFGRAIYPKGESNG